MRNTCNLSIFLLTALALGLFAQFSQASQVLHIFTSNGSYYDDPAVVLSFEVSEILGQPDKVRFDFYNESNDVECSIARIYFDDDKRPALVIPDLQHGPRQGEISLTGPPDGKVHWANFKYEPLVGDRKPALDYRK